MCLSDIQNAGRLLLFVFSHVGVRMTESFPANTVSRKPKIGEEESKSLQRSFHKSAAYKNKEFINFFLESQINKKVKGLVLDPSGTLQDYADLHKA